MLARKSSAGVKKNEHFKEETYSNNNILKSINAANKSINKNKIKIYRNLKNKEKSALKLAIS